jgi:phage-related protein
LKGEVRLYKVVIYEDRSGYSDVKTFISGLKKQSSTNKDSRINFNKVIAYIDLLEEMGTRVGEPITKHLDGDIWELRPLANRILYAYHKDDTFVLLHHFIKKSRKTPAKEIQRAKKELEDYIARCNENE